MPGGIDGQMDLDPLILLAEIPQVFSGFSGHADTSELRDLIESFRSRIAPNSLQGPIADIGLIGTPVHANHSSDTVLGGDHCFFRSGWRV